MQERKKRMAATNVKEVFEKVTEFFNTKLSLKLAKASLACIQLNMFGFTLWFRYASPGPYNFLSLIYYSWILWILISAGGLYVGFFGNAWHRIQLCGLYLLGLGPNRKENI